MIFEDLAIMSVVVVRRDRARLIKTTLKLQISPPSVTCQLSASHSVFLGPHTSHLSPGAKIISQKIFKFSLQ